MFCITHIASDRWMTSTHETTLRAYFLESYNYLNIVFSISQQYYLTWRDMSTQLGILSKFASKKLWTVPSKEQYLPAYFKRLCDDYVNSGDARRVFPVEVSDSYIAVDLKKDTQSAISFMHCSHQEAKAILTGFQPWGRGGTPIWHRRGYSSEILNLISKGDQSGRALSKI